MFVSRDSLLAMAERAITRILPLDQLIQTQIDARRRDFAFRNTKKWDLRGNLSQYIAGFVHSFSTQQPPI